MARRRRRRLRSCALELPLRLGALGGQRLVLRAQANDLHPRAGGARIHAGAERVELRAQLVALPPRRADLAEQVVALAAALVDGGRERGDLLREALPLVALDVEAAKGLGELGARGGGGGRQLITLAPHVLRRHLRRVRPPLRRQQALVRRLACHLQPGVARLQLLELLLRLLQGGVARTLRLL